MKTKLKNLLILISITTLLLSCSQTVHNYEWEKACKLCHDNQGLKELEKSSLTTRVKCNDGTTIAMKDYRK